MGASVATGITLGANENYISVYPNPAKDLLNVDITTPIDITNAKSEITNALGQVVQTSFIKQTNTQLNIQQLNSGVYFIEVKTNNGVLRKKFVKE